MRRFCSLILMCFALSSPAIAAEEGDGEGSGAGDSESSAGDGGGDSSAEKEIGFWFEGRMDLKGSSELIGWYQKDLTEMFGVYGLVSMESNDRFRQGYAGVTAKPLPSLLPWLQIGAGLGRERDSEGSGVRRNLFISVDADKYSGFATYETGYTEPWYRAHLVYNFNKQFSAGAMHETVLKGAARVEYHIKKNMTVLVEVFKGNKRLAVNFSF